MRKYFQQISVSILFAFYLLFGLNYSVLGCPAKCDSCWIFFCCCDDDAQAYHACDEWDADVTLNCKSNVLDSEAQELIWRSRSKIEYSPMQDPIDIRYRVSFSNCYFTGLNTPLTDDGCSADWYDNSIDFFRSEVETCDIAASGDSTKPGDRCYYKSNRCGSIKSGSECIFESMARDVNVALVRYRNTNPSPSGQFQNSDIDNYIKKAYGKDYPSFVCTFLTTEDREDDGGQFIGCVKEKFLPAPPPFGIIPTYAIKPVVQIPDASYYSRGGHTTNEWFSTHNSTFEKPVVFLTFLEKIYKLEFQDDLISGNPYARCSSTLNPAEGGQYTACLLPNHPEYICVYAAANEELEKTADFSEYSEKLIGCTPRPSISEGSNYTITADTDIVCALPSFDLKSLQAQGGQPKIPSQISSAGYDYANFKCFESGYRPYVGVVPVFVSIVGGGVIGKDTSDPSNNVYLTDKTKYFMLYTDIKSADGKTTTSVPSSDGIIKLNKMHLLNQGIKIQPLNIALKDQSDFLGYDYNVATSRSGSPAAMREVFLYYQLLKTSDQHSLKIIGQKPMYGKDQAIIGPGIITNSMLSLALFSSDSKAAKSFADFMKNINPDKNQALSDALKCIDNCGGGDVAGCITQCADRGSIVQTLLQNGLRPTIAPLVKTIIPCLPDDPSCIITQPKMLVPSVSNTATTGQNCLQYQDSTAAEFYFFPKNVEGDDGKGGRIRDFCYCDAYNCSVCQDNDCADDNNPCKHYSDWSTVLGQCKPQAASQGMDCTCPLCGTLGGAKTGSVDLEIEQRVCPGIYQMSTKSSFSGNPIPLDKICFYPTENWDFISGKQIVAGSFWQSANVDITTKSLVCAQLPSTCMAILDDPALWNHYGNWMQGSTNQMGVQTTPIQSGATKIPGTCQTGWELMNDAHLYGVTSNVSPDPLCISNVVKAFAANPQNAPLAAAAYVLATTAFNKILNDKILSNKQISPDDFSNNSYISAYLALTDHCLLSVGVTQPPPIADCVGGAWTNFAGGYCVKQ